MSVFDEINAMSAETILNKLNLPLARDGESYVCPICGNGSKGDPRHGHGDGIKPRINALGRVRWKCFHCKKDFSNFELAAASMGLNTDYDLAEAARQVGELFGLTEERQQPFSFSRGVSLFLSSESKELANLRNVGEFFTPLWILPEIVAVLNHL